MTVELDHLVVVADSLEQGAIWCEATLGVRPAHGGRHALMGTHNLLLRLHGQAFPAAYLEIIAIDPAAPAPERARWFGMNTPALRESACRAPRLVHWVGRSAALEHHRDGLRTLALDPGEVLAAQRDTAAGTLRWRITVPRDGRPLCHGALPTLIEWQGRHPSPAMPPSGVALLGFELRGVPQPAATLLGLQAWIASTDGPPIRVRLQTPRGDILLGGGSVDALPCDASNQDLS